jgi:alpha-galactosidase
VGEAAYLGSSLHISQGLEVKEWRAGEYLLSLLLSPERRASACVDLFIPHEITKASFSGKPVVGEVLSEHCYRFQLDIDHNGTLNLSY